MLLPEGFPIALWTPSAHSHVCGRLSKVKCLLFLRLRRSEIPANQGIARGEITLLISGGGGQLFQSGTSPAAGISFTQTINCQPPPAAPQDCAGGATICGGQSFNNNSANTGNVVDLNLANSGCLQAGERQGTWYYFSPSAGGSIGFTIAPIVATDYDFAVWGPMASVSCPPAGPPLRCSYAAQIAG